MNVVPKPSLLTALAIKTRILALIPSAASRILAVAVSGGADSMALTLLVAEAFPGKVYAFTVDHGLREESAAEAHQVATWLGARSIPHRILPWLGPKPIANLQAEARAARYRLLEQACSAVGATLLLTAHHKEDQAETLLLRLARGAGLPGLSAMKSVRRLSAGLDLLLMRPLLDVSRDDLRAYLSQHNQPWIEDPSNQDQRYDRIKVRTLLANPPLPGLTHEAIIQSAKALASAHTALEAWTLEKVRAHMTWDNLGKIVLHDRMKLAAWPDELARRVLLAGLQAASGNTVPPRRADMLRLMIDVARSDFRAATLSGVILSADGDDLVMVREPRAVTHVVPLGVGVQSFIWDGRYEISVTGMPNGCHVTALGEAGRQSILKQLTEKKTVALAQTQPALWQGDVVLAVPTAGIITEVLNMAAAFIAPVSRFMDHSISHVNHDVLLC